MVLLFTIGLVIVSAVTLLLGFAQDAVSLIYVSIGCSVLAAVILIIAGRSAGGTAYVATATGPAPLESSPIEAGFPIANYDELLVTEVVPVLSTLNAAELAQVRAREESGKARASVLRRIDSEMAARENLPVDEDYVGEPTIATAAMEEDVPLSAASMTDDEEPFPIEDYDDLRVGEVLPLLSQLYTDELERVADHERDNANRDAILERIDELLSPTPTEQKSAPAKKSAAVKKSVAAKKTAAAKKVPAAKQAPVKKTAAATKVPAKKSAAATKAPAKKTTPAAKKAPAKKASAAKKTS